MEKEELIQIKQNPDDKRSKLIKLSEKGFSNLPVLRKLWKKFSLSLQNIMEERHPDILNILDYKPSLKKSFTRLAGNWLSGILNGRLGKEDLIAINNPDKAYLLAGGFLFFAEYSNEIVECAALKRLDENRLEFAKLIVAEHARKLGIAIRLLERCITWYRENKVSELWLQTASKL